jgi:uncharacterized protein YndB with AHSA1/START domain
VTEQSVIVSIEVAADPQLAFQVFTTQIDIWWLRGPKHRFRAPWDGTLTFEPGRGGRLIETYADGTSFMIGRVSQWSPGERLVLSWRLPNFADAETTEVDVRFEAIDGGTRVSVEHRGWHELRADHPARHGKRDREYEYFKAQLWADTLNALRQHFTRINRAKEQP